MYRCTLSKARGLDRPEGDCASHRNMDQWLRAVHSVVPCQALDLSSVPVHKKKTRGSQESGKTSGALFIDGCGAPRRASYSTGKTSEEVDIGRPSPRHRRRREASLFSD